MNKTLMEKLKPQYKAMLENENNNILYPALVKRIKNVLNNEFFYIDITVSDMDNMCTMFEVYNWNEFYKIFERE